MNVCYKMAATVATSTLSGWQPQLIPVPRGLGLVTVNLVIDGGNLKQSPGYQLPNAHNECASVRSLTTPSVAALTSHFSTAGAWPRVHVILDRSCLWQKCLTKKMCTISGDCPQELTYSIYCNTYPWQSANMGCSSDWLERMPYTYFR